MKLYIFVCISFIFTITNGQKKEYPSIQRGDFPEGIYMTLEDVLNKTPSSTTELYFKTALKDDSVNPEKVYFFDKTNDQKVRKPVAVSYKGEMYFQIYRKYTNKDDRGFNPNAYSRFCKVLNYGRFLYFEENMSSAWAGGLLDVINSRTKLIGGNTKGIVLDLENKEFNLLQNCDDLNDFLFEHEIPSVPCDPSQYTIGDLRKEMDKINKPYSNH
ncbi:hypothetical protein C1631_008525 [Chryseobacterium phosphatilyticum]|uniref:Uncharacterized protein n=1 Tax=Chryseobacterium phosphatilyticum TaxID=475075 RepID=A0A316X941_9FLAO|nr:hypothetical protein [Chryseobacterium phosphatilyticum]PWN70034.1 hypothetical protein C1631_008525 [Chryseobacterium phosphatilyticum]